MSLPPDPLPDYLESASGLAPAHVDGGMLAPEPVLSTPEESPVSSQRPFPAWSWKDVAAILVFTLVAIFVFTLLALLVARHFPGYKNASFADVAMDARVVIGAQTAAYPVVLLFIFMMVRTRANQQFGKAIQWNWPGMVAPGYVVGGVVLAIVVESLARYLPIPKSLPMDTYFHDATSAYMMAIFGITLAPLLEELFFRGLLYPLLRRASGVAVAVLLTSVAFAAIHGAQLGYAWAPVLSIFVVGVALTLVRVRTNSVAASFLTHSGYNFALFALLWVGSDHYRHLEKIAG
jgi:membrane protease YdiL (CAAX protease family)